MPYPGLDISNKAILITGGTSGIGRAIALGCAGSGNVVTVFNIGGNKYRLIVSIKYRWAVVYVRDFLTHAEYDKDTWKRRH